MYGHGGLIALTGGAAFNRVQRQLWSFAISDSGKDRGIERGNSLTISCGCGWLESESTAKTPTLLQWGLWWSLVMDR